MMVSSFAFIGLMAGLASAALIATLREGSFLALLLFLLAPLPVLIVALGWDHRAGLVATATGALALLFISTPVAALVYVTGTALPAWGLAYLALLAERDEHSVRWYPSGHLLQACALLAAATFVVTGLVTLGSAEELKNHARDVARLFVQMQTNTPPNAPIPDLGPVKAEDLIAQFARALPFLASQGLTVIFIFYLWAAGRVVHLSSRLPRPWMPVFEAQMPKSAVYIGIAGGLLAFLGTDLISIAGLAVGGALAMAFGLQGLAVIHDRTRDLSFRPLVLCGVYLVLMATQGLAFFVLFLGGVADTLLNLRPARPDVKPPVSRVS